jgi:rhodanese-related sulfurtransferase/rubrerythrin
MRWKQFFTPVQSFSAVEADDFLQGRDAGTYTLLDVRQPGEYEEGHLPGAKLVPLADLGRRMGELDRGRPTIVYCAIGGRSRVAAQMLASQGFGEIYNFSGGIRAWNSKTAIGKEDLGLDLFSGKESSAETLLVAYSLEAGLREFYLALAQKVAHQATIGLFRELSAVEVKHQERIYHEYLRLTGASIPREVFESKVVDPRMEGGLTTDEYIALYQPDLEVPQDVLSLAMAIEAQALDLYQRAADRAQTPEGRTVLLQIANEEHAHLAQLGRLLDSL